MVVFCLFHLFGFFNLMSLIPLLPLYRESPAATLGDMLAGKRQQRLKARESSAMEGLVMVLQLPSSTLTIQHAVEER